MSQIALSGNAAGTATFELQSPPTNTNRIITLPDASGQVSVLDLRTAVTATGTAVDFLNIPATARRITVMFNGVSTNGTSHWLIQIGSGSITNTGYNAVAAGCINAVAPSVTLSTSGFIAFNDSAADVRSGSMEIALLGSNVYVAKHTLGGTGGRSIAWWGGGNVTLSGPLDRIRVTTANGTDVFDAGTINIMVE